jgi:signal transduction histidine kinase
MLVEARDIRGFAKRDTAIDRASFPMLLAKREAAQQGIAFTCGIPRLTVLTLSAMCESSPSSIVCARRESTFSHASIAALASSAAMKRFCCGLLITSFLLGATSVMAAQPMRGLPFTRSYPLSEIRYVSRGPRLNFDAFGRLVLIKEGVYAVLNDTVWINLAAAIDDSPAMVNVVQGPDGRAYYGERGIWGVAERGADGKLRPVSLVEPSPPAWTTTAYFDDIITTPAGVYFGSWNGVVFWNPFEREAKFFELAKGSRIFRVGARVYYSAKEQPLHEVDIASGSMQAVAGTEWSGTVVERGTPLDEKRSLLSFSDGKLMVFDGRTLVQWAPQISHDLHGRISEVQQLADGAVAVAITGKGVFLVAADGRMLSSLTTNQYHLVTGMASREPGVLWVALEDTVEKILYGGPLTVFGERLGLPVDWPILQRWGEKLIVLSDRKLYEALPGREGATGRFRLMTHQPPDGAFAIGCTGTDLLVGSQNAIYAAQADGSLVEIAPFKDLAHLKMVGEDRCYAIGTTEIALFQRENGRWVERVARIPGLRYTPVAHTTKRAVWIELGPDGVARLSEAGGALVLKVLETGWSATPWVNIGVLDDIVVATGMEGHRLYFDETTESWSQQSELDNLLAQSPYWILRLRKDDRGTIWATHGRGVITFSPRDGRYTMDASRLDMSNERYPSLHIFPGNEVWLSTQRSLYHVEPDAAPSGQALQPPSMLVSVMDARRNEELYFRDVPASTPLRLSYDQNSLVFRPFSGSYRWRWPPSYEFRLNNGNQWTRLDAGSTLSISELREGRHLLEIRSVEGDSAPRPAVAFPFVISPPWYRTAWAYSLYGAGSISILLGAVHSVGYLARRRNRVLEEQVKARTAELEVAMERLNEETRNAATLAERDRLAGEIHDSMQQGLSGAIIQLDTTLKMGAVTEHVRSRLNVVRNMISYARHEVQHAVWDMESPLLEGTELGDALRKISALVNVAGVNIETSVTGVPIEMPQTAKHHLLRMAQEATTNAVRHAHASRIDIELRYEPAAVSLTIVDDGIGFVQDEVRSKTFGHFGLRGLRARAEKISGTLTIESAPGTGTLVRIMMPIQARLNAFAPHL